MSVLAFLGAAICVQFGFDTTDFSASDSLSYNISFHEAFYFRVWVSGYSAVSLTITIPGSSGPVTFNTANTSIFYRVYASHVTFSALVGPPSVRLETVRLHSTTCTDYALTVSADKFMNWSHVLTSESRHLCLLFFQPGSVYRLLFGVASDKRNTMCSVDTQDSLMVDRAPHICGANDTCDIYFDDAFVMHVEVREEAVVESFAKLFMIRGREDQTDECAIRKVNFFNESGHFEGPDLEKEVNFECIAEQEPVTVAVSMATCLVLGLVSACLVYYLCRPRRDGYAKDEVIRARKTLPQRTVTGGQRGRQKHGSDNGFGGIQDRRDSRLALALSD